MSHIPRKRFGQNFLRDESVIRRIAAVINLQAGDHLVEIGPGEGAMTAVFLEAGCQLDAVEIDHDLASYLERRFGGISHFRLHRGDALKFDFGCLSSGEGLRMAGNLPYNISTPLLFHLFESQAAIQDMHFMLQKEVVDRLCAEVGDDDYGRLGIMAQYYCRTEKLFEVYPESFYPQPQVVSAIVRLTPHVAKPVEAEPGVLGRVVATAFSQRRKTLRNSLKPLFEEQQLRELGIDPGARAETLDLQAYARLARFLD